MRKRVLILLFCCAYFFTVSAQSNKNKSYQFHSINCLALINGNNGVSGALQTVNGFAKDQWFAGIGVGLDYYQYRTVPVFADLRYEIGKQRNKFFVYGNAGVNFEWAQDYFYDEPSIWNTNSTSQFENGFYNDAGIGLKAVFKNSNAFVLSLGYSRKTMKEIITLVDWRTGNETEQINKYRFNRILLKAGFWF